ncbi:hypothetical protein B4096_0200 [Heyndrickxia coagulans]|nr:hypothetical protein B4100_0372 [Heyndrickxia coagulans]KYC77476.1 hypothetical protein B4096_0200 [Heyndrickxia coagulans]
MKFWDVARHILYISEKIGIIVAYLKKTIDAQSKKVIYFI